MNTTQKTTTEIASRSFPIFTAAALVLLILKLTAYPTISWWVILGVWLFPVLLALTVVGIVLSVAAVFVLFVLIIDVFRR